MIKPDVIISWPKHMDYPLFRYKLEQWRGYFNNVFIAFTQDTNPVDVSQFVVNNVKDVTFVKSPVKYEDWRQNAVRDVIDNFVDNEYVLFFEQDFLINGFSFFDRVFDLHRDYIGYIEGERMHPAFAVVRTEVIHETSKEFSAQPPKYDHFGKFFAEVTNKHEYMDLKDFDFVEREDFYHMAGLTQNYHVFDEGQPFYKPDEFLTYNALSLQLPIEIEPVFKAKMQKIKDKYGEGNCEFLKQFYD